MSIVQSEGAREEVGLRRLEAARREVSRTPPESSDTEPSRAAMERALGRRIRDVEIIRRSRNTSLYRLTPEDGQEATLLKWSHWKSPGEVAEEYRTLQSLYDGSNGIDVARPVGSMPPSGYFAEEVPGTTLAGVATRGEDGEDTCRRAGALLARLHDIWKVERRPVPWRDLVTDLQSIPGGLTARERRLAKGARRAIGDRAVRWSRLYLDFDPKNIIVRPSGDLCLIDPPEVETVGPVWWDVATFLVGLRKAALRHRPWSRIAGSTAITRSQRAFLAGYGTGSGEGMEKLLRLFAIQRLGELLIYQSASDSRSRFVPSEGWFASLTRFVKRRLLQLERRTIARDGFAGRGKP